MPGGMKSLGPRGFLTDEEKNNMPKVTGALIKRILSYLKPYIPQFIFVFIAIIPLLVIPSRSVGKTRCKIAAEGQTKRDEMNQIINETLSVSGSMLVKIFTREKTESEHFDKVNNDVAKIAMKEQRSGHERRFSRHRNALERLRGAPHRRSGHFGRLQPVPFEQPLLSFHP